MREVPDRIVLKTTDAHDFPLHSSERAVAVAASVLSLPVAPPSCRCVVLPLPSAIQQGVTVEPCVLDFSPHLLLHVSVYAPASLALPKGTPIASLLPVPAPPSDPPVVAAAMRISAARPTLALTVNGSTINGLVDTGADMTVIAAKDWPSSWPLVPSGPVAGVGGPSFARRSLHPLLFQSNTGQQITLAPLVMDLPLSLWGRDLLASFQTTLDSNLF